MTTTAALIYLDNNATTRPAPEVVAAMLPFYTEHWGNPSSLHQFGRDCATALDTARSQVAALLCVTRASQLVFTSSGTEADNLALHALCTAQPDKKHVVTTAVEHSAHVRYCRMLAERGYDITTLPVDRTGQLDVAALAAALRDDTACVAIMWSNNETGVCFPIAEIAALCVKKNIPLHVDAVQAAGKIPIDVERVPVTTLAISGHKIHAPKGVGALYVRRGTPFRAMLLGGGQEHGRRSGTENVAQIVGLGVAAQLAQSHLSQVASAVGALRDQLERGLLANIPRARVNGATCERAPNTTNMSIPGVDGEGLILALSQAGVAASTGSACSQGSTEPSHVLVAMHLSPEDLRGTLRLSLSRETTAEEIAQALEIIPRVVAERRSLS